MTEKIKRVVNMGKGTSGTVQYQEGRPPHSIGPARAGYAARHVLENQGKTNRGFRGIFWHLFQLKRHFILKHRGTPTQ